MRVQRVKIEVREATEEDLDQVANLWKDLAEHHAELSEDFSLTWDSKRRWSRYLREKFAEVSTKLIVATDGDRIVGFMLCMLSPNIPIYEERKLGIVSDAYVLERRRGKGIAKKMLDVGLRWFRENKVRTIELNVACVNTDGQTAWERLGFSPFMIRERLHLDDLGNGSPARAITRTVRRERARGKSLRRRFRSSRKPS